jgi:6-phosphogluconolactonase (cycloisomerase 2 family)
MNPPGLGPIMQIAYVVPDLHEAVQTWVRTMSIGPFFVREHVQYVEAEFEGKPCHADLSVAFALSD